MGLFVTRWFTLILSHKSKNIRHEYLALVSMSTFDSGMINAVIDQPGCHSSSVLSVWMTSRHLVWTINLPFTIKAQQSERFDKSNANRNSQVFGKIECETISSLQFKHGSGKNFPARRLSGASQNKEAEKLVVVEHQQGNVFVHGACECVCVVRSALYVLSDQCD